ncbi:SDR family NAD(P)-dependent oxidoreductase [Streptomyces sp. NBC_00306]|uniref:SDR family NAD(P)-dependent oxidoreductase n=1 Tax=Streptomyces sp. NBC_00306 TaxID=2975708 RepID=UPI002E2D1ED1|nr:SDR family NAD(P)-dependent oxidoreductase [Streptomyces sp. NBC_00306]
MKKSILITGATSGIGRAATIEFASQGYQVFATYRADDHRGELAAIDNVHPIRMDVTDAADLERAYATVAEAVGGDGLYAVLNNAGITYSAPFEYLDEKRAREGGPGGAADRCRARSRPSTSGPSPPCWCADGPPRPFSRSKHHQDHAEPGP